VAAKRRGQQLRARSDTAVVPRARVPTTRRLHLRHHLVPSPRSVAVGLALVALAGGAYAFARETSTFAIRTIDVVGGPPDVRAQARRALAPLLGSSLVGLDGAALERRLEALPAVVSADYDRTFPHTLRVDVVAERPVAVVRSGREAWVVSARARVVARVSRASAPPLPRIWLPARVHVRAGAFLPPGLGGSAVEALGLASRFPPTIRTASVVGGSLVFHLRSGLDLRLGDPADIRLKLAVARRALAAMPSGMTYLDVSVPGRPVAGSGGTPPTSQPQFSTGG
jgi:cell division protein FtsQ